MRKIRSELTKLEFKDKAERDIIEANNTLFVHLTKGFANGKSGYLLVGARPPEPNNAIKLARLWTRNQELEMWR